jgi:hypothetical protein
MDIDLVKAQLMQVFNNRVNILIKTSSPYINQASHYIQEFKTISKSASEEHLGFEMPKYRQQGWNPSQVPYTEMLIVFTLLISLWEFYLELRQHRCLYDKEIPTTLVDAVDNLDKEIEETNSKNTGKIASSSSSKPKNIKKKTRK